MVWTIIHIIDIILWLVMAGSTAYVLFFALAGLLPRKRCPARPDEDSHKDHRSFLILFPAYGEDTVIMHSVSTALRQEYPEEKFHVAVISDHMQPATNDALRQLPITLLTPAFDKSSKAKAMQYAIRNVTGSYDHVVILDADNTVEPDFLRRLERTCREGHKAIQCHRCAKNSDNNIAVLDGLSEEINNTIFRKGHNRIGLSSALIGSGMCFTYSWFRDNVGHLSTAGEDRELEALLLKQGIYIKYEEDIHVRDEKVSCGDNFQRQRQRWMSAQLNSLVTMLPCAPGALIRGNINFVDKTLQQMLVPRSLLLACTLAIAVLMLIAVPVWSAKWWLLFAVLGLSVFIAIPSSMRTRAIFGCLTAFPTLALRMLSNVRKINRGNKDFIHTTHDK